MENENLLASNVDYLKDALAVLSELRNAKDEKGRLNSAIKQIERDITAEERAENDEIEETINSRKDEIAGSFDREIRKDQEKIKKIRADREKARSKGIAGRIEVETADVREENRQIRVEIKGLLKENRLPLFCGKGWYFTLFAPKKLIELLVFLLIFILWGFVMPYLISLVLPSKETIWLLAVSFACSLLFFVLYQWVCMRTKVPKWQVICQIRALRDKISANHRKIKAIKNAIMKDRNEQGYNLESFDREISELEKEVSNTTAEKQEALQSFEETTKEMLIEEIKGRYRQDIEELKDKKQDAAGRLKEAEVLEKDIHKHLTANYEAFLGKDYVKEDAIQDMIILMESDRASTVAEALALYKSEH